MTVQEEEKLFAALRGPILTVDKDDNDLRDAIALDDLKMVTPAVDEMLRNAEARGRFAQLLEDADAILRQEMADR